jgi:hypothetical protein
MTAMKKWITYRSLGMALRARLSLSLFVGKN